MRMKLRVFLIVMVLAQPARPTDDAAKTSTIGILAFDDVLTSEVTAPMEVFGAASEKEWFSTYRVMLVSGTKNKYIRTAEGLKIIADATIYDEMKLDVLIVPGTYDLEGLTSNQAIMSFIRTKGQEVLWLASNCSGAFLLAHAGLLDGVKATTWAGGEGVLKESYPNVDVQFDKNVVVDGHVITSNGGVVSYEAAFKLLGQLATTEHASEIMEMLQFTRVNEKK